MDARVDKLIKNLKQRNISGLYCENKEEASQKILEIISEDSTIGFSGSVTLEEVGVIKKLQARGNKVFNPYEAGISREESLSLRRQGAQAEVYLASANAISLEGELVFFSAYGNRTAGISHAKNVIIVCGINKITPDLAAALERVRGYVTPLNHKRLNWPENKQMCCQILIIESEIIADRLKVILVGEELGF
ncbi:MAG: lactate utilization protein [Candidatus Omnitrophota bacterium]